MTLSISVKSFKKKWLTLIDKVIIERLNYDFVYQRQKLQKEVAARQGELFIGTEEKVRKAIEDLVLENDYDMILPRAAALYVGDLYDVTRKVTEKLNQAATAQ